MLIEFKKSEFFKNKIKEAIDHYDFNLLLDCTFKEGIFDKHGKWMDGWETRRRRSKGYDYLIIKLGRPGKIFNADIDTTYFSGNQPTHASLQACFSNKNKPNNPP